MLGASQHKHAATGSFTVPSRAGKAFHTRTVTLEPGATKQVALGSYFASEPKPQFDVTVSPTELHTQTNAALELITIPGTQKCVAFYHLHNSSGKQCDITIVKRD